MSDTRSASPVAATPAPPNRSRLALWAAVGVLNLGAVGAAFYLGKHLAARGPHHQGAAEQPAPPAHPRAEANAPPDAPADLEAIDSLVRGGRYELALGLCQPVWKHAAAELVHGAGYRRALCLEGLGRSDDALAEYRAAASRGPVPVIRWAAQLGQARVWVRMGRPAEAKNLLCDLVLRSGEAGLRGHALLGDARYLLALSEALEAQEPPVPGLVSDAPVRHAPDDWGLGRALDWGGPARGGPAAEAPGPDWVMVKRVGAGPEGILVQASSRDLPLTAVLARVGERGGLKVEWTPRARQQAEGRVLPLCLGPIPLADFLEPCCARLGLAWAAGGGRLTLRSEEEAAGWRGGRAERAARALADAVGHFPRHPMAAAAYLEWGNLEAARGRAAEAAGWYGKLIREWPRSPLVTEAHYNRGLLLRKGGKGAPARRAFYQVIDRSPGHRLIAPAYYWIGLSYLEENEPGQALSPLRRAVVASRKSPARPAFAVALAAAYLLADNPGAANAVLVEHREGVNQPELRRGTAFLDTLARTRCCPAEDRRARNRNAGDLLASVLELRNAEFLGAPGLLLLAQAYRDLGMDEALVPFGAKALAGLRGPLAVEMASLLADACLATDDRAGARKYYAAVAGGPGPKAAGARLRLAELALAEGDAAGCVKGCEALLKGKGVADRAAVLRLLARAYEKAGRRDDAIRCLTGKWP